MLSVGILLNLLKYFTPPTTFCMLFFFLSHCYSRNLFSIVLPNNALLFFLQSLIISPLYGSSLAARLKNNKGRKEKETSRHDFQLFFSWFTWSLRLFKSQDSFADQLSDMTLNSSILNTQSTPLNLFLWLLLEEFVVLSF